MEFALQWFSMPSRVGQWNLEFAMLHRSVTRIELFDHSIPDRVTSRSLQFESLECHALSVRFRTGLADFELFKVFSFSLQDV